MWGSWLVEFPHLFQIVLLLISVGAGLLGALLGLGGGIIIVPVLTLLFGVNIRYAIGASVVAIIATSSGAAATYVRDRMTNIRVAMFLEVATTLGAIAGAALAAHLASRYLFIIFAVILVLSGVMMLRRRDADDQTPAVVPSALAKRLKLSSSYPDSLLKKEIPYHVNHVVLGFSLMVAAGIISGLLGVGSGVLKVPAMDTAMNLPMKVSSATSNFMIGVTGAASAGVYFMRGDIVPFLAAPVALGVLLGSFFGTRVMVRLDSGRIRKVFIVVLVVVAAQMVMKAFAGGAQ